MRPQGLPKLAVEVCVMVTRARCWARRSAFRWTSGCGSGWSRRRAGSRRRCWSGPGGRRRRTGRRVRVAGRASAVGADRGKLRPPACGAPGGYPAAAAGGGGGARWRSGAGVAGSRAARDRGPGGRRHRRTARDWHAGHVSAPASPLSGVPSRLARGEAGGASRAGGRDRPCRSIPIAVLGILPKRRRGSMRRSPPSLNARWVALRRAVGWRPRRRSWSGPPR